MKILKRISKTKIGHVIIGFFLFLITKLIFKSIKWNCLNEENQHFINNLEDPLIFCCWHNRLFFGPHFLPRKKIINALQSGHSDAIMNITFKLLSIKTITGSSNKKGAQAFIKMVKSIQNKESIAISPDGPKGPKQKIKPGLIKLAQITKAPIIPLIWFTKKHKILDSWDRFIIPLPFSNGVFLFGNPIYINRKLNKIEFEKKVLYVEKKINELTLLVENEYINK